MSDSSPVATFSYLTDELNKLQLGYLHVVDPIAAPKRVAPILREIFENTFVVNGGFDFSQGNAAIARGEADLVAFGVPFLANPDLRAGLRKPQSSTPPTRRRSMSAKRRATTIQR
jgi:N-ethylmaleimide reductase